VSSITIVSDDATIWSVTYDRHYDDRNSFIIQATACIGRYHLPMLQEIVVVAATAYIMVPHAVPKKRQIENIHIA
jgi:hypothetical protein